MSISVIIHDPTIVRALDHGSFGVLRFCGEGGSEVNVFMPFAVAEAMRIAFEGMQPPRDTHAAATLPLRYGMSSTYEADMRDAGRGHLLGDR